MKSTDRDLIGDRSRAMPLRRDDGMGAVAGGKIGPDKYETGGVNVDDGFRAAWTNRGEAVTNMGLSPSPALMFMQTVVVRAT